MSTVPTGDDKSKSAPTVEELSEQIQNLNKGIAKYRDDATDAKREALEAKSEATAAKEAADALKAKNDKKDDKADDVQLSPADQKKLEAWAKQQGFVTKEENNEEKARLFNESIKGIESQAIDEFVKSHPEYEDSEKWQKVVKEFGQYKQPQSITAYRQILNKIHKELAEDDKEQEGTRAKQEKRKRLGLGGSNAKSDDSDGEFEKLREKYPHLSVEQIESRLIEINQLTEARAKRAAERKK